VFYFTLFLIIGIVSNNGMKIRNPYNNGMKHSSYFCSIKNLKCYI